MGRARLVGINHVALEVGDLDEALAFYGRWLEFELRGRVRGMAFLDAGDQFLAFSEGRSQGPDRERHFGLVVDDRDAVRAALAGAGIVPEPGRGLQVRDPWGNVVEIVDYREVQFTKAPGVLAGMGLGGLEKTADAQRELAEKGLAGQPQSSTRSARSVRMGPVVRGAAITRPTRGSPRP
jgi:lactoylglutathione lyase